jgi:outer membrane protein OmpA-like peptidoglycan-associated protein/uncharacterized protein YidB (DUF937 family)
MAPEQGRRTILQDPGRSKPMFDAILENVASRFGISLDKARQLLAMLSSLIFSPDQGGPAGFVDRLRASGLGDTVQSWIGDGPNQPISPAQLEGALGAGEIASIASRAGLDTTTTGNALSGLLPDVFSKLTEGGQLPTSMPAGLSGLLGGFGGTLGNLGQGGAAAAGAGAAAIGAGAASLGSGAGRAADSVASAVSSRDTTVATGRSKWPVWIGLIVVLALGWFLLRGCHREAPMDERAPPATEPAATSESAAPATDTAAADTAAADTAAAASAAAAAAAADTTSSTPADAGAELDKLSAGEGAVSADDLVKALNLMIIHFDTGSARISADSQDILVKAATAIRRAPAGTRIEVGGHTDNTGNAASNQTLSQARAEAVAKQLASNGVDAGMLASKGYGQDKPVADNATDEGRAKNRRIEFTVQQ